jgi:hypothetical protein
MNLAAHTIGLNYLRLLAICLTALVTSCSANKTNTSTTGNPNESGASNRSLSEVYEVTQKQKQNESNKRAEYYNRLIKDSIIYLIPGQKHLIIDIKTKRPAVSSCDGAGENAYSRDMFISLADRQECYTKNIRIIQCPPGTEPGGRRCGYKTEYDTSKFPNSISYHQVFNYTLPRNPQTGNSKMATSVSMFEIIFEGSKRGAPLPKLLFQQLINTDTQSTVPDVKKIDATHDGFDVIASGCSLRKKDSKKELFYDGKQQMLDWRESPRCP